MARVTIRFTGTLFRVESGGGAWTFVEVPERLAPPVQHGWGRTSVVATVDAHRWATSVWRGKTGRTMLPVPKAARGAKGDGDAVRVRLEFNL